MPTFFHRHPALDPEVRSSLLSQISYYQGKLQGKKTVTVDDLEALWSTLTDIVEALPR